MLNLNRTPHSYALPFGPAVHACGYCRPLLNILIPSRSFSAHISIPAGSTAVEIVKMEAYDLGSEERTEGPALTYSDINFEVTTA
jgi:hypothetical protein